MRGSQSACCYYNQDARQCPSDLLVTGFYTFRGVTFLRMGWLLPCMGLLPVRLHNCNFSRCCKTSFELQSFLVVHQWREYGKQTVKSQIKSREVQDGKTIVQMLLFAVYNKWWAEKQSLNVPLTLTR